MTTIVARPRLIVETDGDRGHFESVLADFPGFIRLPHPLMLKHVSEWWKSAVEPIKDKTPLDWEFQYADWLAAKNLILAYGEWGIKGVSESAVKNDDVPAEVMAMVTEVTNSYISPFLPSKARRRLLAIT